MPNPNLTNRPEEVTMDATIHKVTGLRIEKTGDSRLHTIDLVIEYEDLAFSRPQWEQDNESFGYAKLESTITLFISDTADIETVLWKAIADLTSDLANA
jgi:hypothetical protein